MTGPPPLLQQRYRLTAWLAHGSATATYRARDEQRQLDVAVTFPQPPPGAAPVNAARLLAAAPALRQLAHPHILPLLDAGEAAGLPYLVTPLVAADSLTQRLAAGLPLPLAEALHITRAILDACAYAHERAVYHGAICPDAVLLPADGRILIRDWGLALAFDADWSAADDARAPRRYLAPEQQRGAPPSAPGDLYAAGALLYALLTGRPPAPSAAGHLPRPPGASNPLVPPAVDQAVMTLLAAAPAARFPSAAAARDALAPDTAVLPAAALSERPAATAGETAAAAVEAERRRVARQMARQLIEPLNLLLAQAQAYEQGMADNPAARMAISVLSTLARQLLQQTRDLQTALHPEALDNLGLAPALEGLAQQLHRSHGVSVRLDLARLPQRPPQQTELHLFRSAQQALQDAIVSRRATQLTVHLRLEADELRLEIRDNGLPDAAPAASRQTRVPLNAPPELTARETAVIRLLAQGLSNREIALSLGVSPRTVAFHLDNIYGKLGVRSRTEAAVLALRHGWTAQES